MSRSIVILLAASIATFLGAAGIARADSVVYEWTDAHGVVHYSDQWVAGAKLIHVETAHAPADTSAMQGIQNESNAVSRELKNQEDAQAVQDDEAKARAQRCAQDKSEYQKLIEARRVFTTNSNGERHYMSDSDIEAARLKARQAMDADCGSG